MGGGGGGAGKGGGGGGWRQQSPREGKMDGKINSVNENDFLRLTFFKL